MKLLVSLCFASLLLTSVLLSTEFDRLEGDIKEIYNRVSPSIVSVHYGVEGENGFVGTGIVVDEGGYIVTIKRFIRDDTIWVETDKGEMITAELLGSDPETGIAVLKVKKKIKPAKVCNIEALVPGDLLFVIGNSFGLQNGISISIFSGKRGEDDLLQLGNAVLPGNSGAGVFNMKGELVGIVSFALRTSLFYGAPEIKSVLREKLKIDISQNTELTDGAGVLIPCEKMMEISNEIITHGKIERGWLGVFIKEEDEKIIVSGLVDDGPAQKAGIEKDDIFISYDDKDVKELGEFVKVVKKTKPGSTVRILVKRGKKNKKFDVKIEPRPGDDKLYRLREILPDLKFFYEKDELKELREEIEKLKEELEKKDREGK